MATIKTVVANFDGGGSALTTGNTGVPYTAPYTGTITGYSISADVGTCTITTWLRATGTAIPTVSNIISSAGVQLTTGTHVRSTTVTDFSVGTATAVVAGDMITFAITAVAGGATKIIFGLEITT